MKNSYIIVLAIIALLALGGYFLMREAPQATPETPDQVDDSLEEATDAESEVSFSYPEQLPTQYMSVVDWPPRILKLAEAYSCTEAGEATARAGATEERTIEGTRYCVTLSSEGAAGSIYEQYAYVFEKDGQVLSMTFSIRLPQCGNYDETERLACEGERISFSIDELVHEIAQTIRL